MEFSNPYFLFTILSLIVLFKLDIVAQFLNASHLKKPIPKEFDTLVNEEQYERSREYSWESARFELIQSAFSTAVFVAFWLLGGFGWVDNWVRSLGYGTIVTGLIYISTLYIANLIISIPFDLYDTFVIEEKYGFNKTTAITFIVDQIKGLFLFCLLGLPVMALIMWIFGKWPNAWFIAWIFISAWMLLMMWIAPKWLMPLFNRFKPLPEGELRSASEALGKKCGFPAVEIFEMDGSKRSAKSNAFFSGMGSNKIIAFFDTLIAKHNTQELVAILAHEIGHYKLGHIWKMLAASLLNIALMFFCMGYLINQPTDLLRAFGIHQPSIYAVIVVFSILIAPFSQLWGILQSILSRKHEYEADAFAAKVTGRPQDLITALKKLSLDNLSNLTPHPFYVKLHYSHPPVVERISALESFPKSVSD